MEELFEGGLLAAEELDVVDQEDVDLAVASVEFVGEFLRCDVADLEGGVLDEGVVADGVQEVGFAQSAAAVDA